MIQDNGTLFPKQDMLRIRLSRISLEYLLIIFDCSCLQDSSQRSSVDLRKYGLITACLYGRQQEKGSGVRVPSDAGLLVHLITLSNEH